MSKYIKDHKNDDRFHYADDSGYIFDYMGPVSTIQVLFDVESNQQYILIKGSYYDYQEAWKLITKLLLEYIMKDKELINKYSFEYNEDYNVIFMTSNDKNIINNINASKKEYDRLLNKIKLDINISNFENTNIVNNIKKEIKNNKFLDNNQKQHLQYELNIWLMTLKDIKEQLQYVSEEDKELINILDELGIRLNKAGYPSSKQTWYKGFPIDPSDYFYFSIYDPYYSGTNSDYDNGIIDKNENMKFINIMRKIYRSMSKEFNCKFEESIYRGHGLIIISKNSL